MSEIVDVIAEVINIQVFVTAIIVAVPTSCLSVYWALKKYRTEKWWDNKAQCYIDTISAMNDIIRFCDATLAEGFDDIAVINNMPKELGDKFHEGKALIESQLNIGWLLMSDKAYKDLLMLDQALLKSEIENDFSQQIAGIRVETEDCLYSFIPHAKEDLGVQNL